VPGFLFGLFLCSTGPAWGWGDLGHQTVAEIAERRLSPNAKQFLLKIMGPEPLAAMATWPDQVRSDPRFKPFAPYHFLEIRDGFTFYNTPRAKKDSDTILRHAPRQIFSNAVSAEQTRILMRYLVHLVGDVHQPLHIGNGIDMGANLCDVKFTSPLNGQQTVENLHSVWDENLFEHFEHQYRETRGPSTSKRYFGYKEMSDRVERKYRKPGSFNAAIERAIEFSPLDIWYEESRIHHRYAYPDSDAPRDRRYCKQVDPFTGKVEAGAYDETQIPELSPQYVAQSLRVIEQRLYRGGLRLAFLLNQMGATAAKNNQLSTDKPQDILDQLLIEN